jgi:hypothetical protein
VARANGSKHGTDGAAHQIILETQSLATTTMIRTHSGVLPSADGASQPGPSIVVYKSPSPVVAFAELSPFSPTHSSSAFPSPTYTLLPLIAHSFFFRYTLNTTIKMKSTFFLTAFAATALAAPLNVGDATRIPTTVTDGLAGPINAPIVGGPLDLVEDTVGKNVVANGLLGGLAKGLKVPSIPVKRALTDAAGVTNTLGSCVESVKGHTALLNAIGTKAKSGDLPKVEAQEQAVAVLGGLKVKLSETVTKLTGTTGITFADGEAELVLTLVVETVTGVVTSVGTIVEVLGLTPVIKDLLTAVLGLVAQILSLVLHLVPTLVPNVVAILSPVLATVGQGVVVPLLTPIVAVIGSLSIKGLLPILG